MPSARMRNVLLNEVSTTMLEHGKVLSRYEWDRTQGVPYSSRVILRHFSSWPRLVMIMEQTMPAFMSELENLKTKSNLSPLEALSAAG